MTSDVGQPEPSAPKPRGEAGWKAHKERIAARNDAARKVGRAEREERELAAVAKRRAEERRVDEQLLRSHQAHRPTG
jgi:hypothetical protein